MTFLDVVCGCKFKRSHRRRFLSHRILFPTLATPFARFYHDHVLTTEDELPDRDSMFENIGPLGVKRSPAGRG